MLEARRLVSGYRGVEPGDALDLIVREGERLCLLGPNGAGKTCLFRTLLGLIPPLAGNVLLDGRRLATLSRRDVAKALGYVPQVHTAFFGFTVADSVLMGRALGVGLFDVPSERDRAAADAALRKVGIADLATASCTRISGGERQLVLIARALAQAPRCLIMDEPTANLDLGNRARVLAQIARLAVEGMSVLFSTHDPDHAFQCADRVALMDRGGRLIAIGVPDDVMTPSALRALYGVDVEFAFVDGVGRKICALTVRDGGSDH